MNCIVIDSDLIFVPIFRVLIEGVKYNAEKPNMIGKTFLRLERDFDKHVIYCRDEPMAQDLLAEREDISNYFKVSQRHLTGKIVCEKFWENSKVLRLNKSKRN